MEKDRIITSAVTALKHNGINAVVVDNNRQAREMVLSLIPKGAEVFTMTSVTLETTGIASAINDSGDYKALRPLVLEMDRNTRGREMLKMRAAPEYAIGSVQAVTADGQVIMASNTGSQLAAYVFGAGKVIWVVGQQKVVRDLEDGIKRIYEDILPQETERLKKLTGKPSNVSKLLIVKKEVVQDRITLIIVREKLGF